MNKQIIPEKITRNEINAAMAQFLEKGGKIKKIKKQVTFNDDAYDDLFSREESYLNMNYTSSPL